MTYGENNLNSYNAAVEYRKENFDMAVKYMEEIIGKEKIDDKFYEYLLDLASTKEEKEIIKSIKDDKIKHNKILNKIYTELTRKNIEYQEMGNLKKPQNFVEGITEALFSQITLIGKYRKIMMSIPYFVYRDMLLAIITDAIKHGIKYNYLLCLNNCNKKNNVDRKEKLTKKVNEVSDSIAEIGNTVLSKTKEKLKEQNIMEEIIMPSLILGFKRSYMNDDEKIKTKINIKKDVVVSYISEIVEYGLDKVKEKIDIDDIFEKCVIPQILQNK